MYKKILVAFDNSEPALRALDHATELSKIHGCKKITVVHVNEPITIYDPMTIDVEGLLEQENNVIKKSVADFFKNKEIDYELKIFKGKPAQTIADFAKEFQFDLIIVGRIGKKALAEVLLGSVSKHLVKVAPCPVLIMK